MTLIKRLKNLWKLSEWVPFDEYKYTKPGTSVTTIAKEPVETSGKMAQIIRKKPIDPVEEIIKHE